MDKALSPPIGHSHKRIVPAGQPSLEFRKGLNHSCHDRGEACSLWHEHCRHNIPMAEADLASITATFRLVLERGVDQMALGRPQEKHCRVARGRKQHEVSAIGTVGHRSIGGGIWSLGRRRLVLGGGADERDSIEAIRGALDVGITLIDTAPTYGLGHSEEIVGKAIKGRRDEVILATKCGLVWHTDRGSTACWTGRLTLGNPPTARATTLQSSRIRHSPRGY